MKAMEKKFLPSKTYWFCLAFILFEALIVWNYFGLFETIAVLPYGILIYAIGRYKQQKRNPDKIS